MRTLTGGRSYVGLVRLTDWGSRDLSMRGLEKAGDMVQSFSLSPLKQQPKPQHIDARLKHVETETELSAKAILHSNTL